MTRVLYFGDIFGKPGRQALVAALPDLLARFSPHIVLCNVENLAGGRGVNRRSYQELLNLGFHGFTSGNHIWDNKEVLEIFAQDSRIIRPANFPSPRGYACPGKGVAVIEGNGRKLRVINLLGRVFMADVDCPFQAVDTILAESSDLPTFVDMHCDATSEKNAMAWHLAGRVSAVVGSHSHVQTADERVLPGGTAYITDVGMTGALDSVIGYQPVQVIQKYLTRRPFPSVLSTAGIGYGCVVIDIDSQNRATSITRIRASVDAKVLSRVEVSE